MGKAGLRSRLRKMRLADGTLWTMPITLDVAGIRREAQGGRHVALRDAEGVMLARSTCEDIWEPDKAAEGEGRLRHDRRAAPGRQLPDEPAASRSTSAAQSRVEPPLHYDYKRLRDTPRELRERSRSSAGARSSPSKPATRCTARTTSSRSAPRKEDEANLLVHPVVGMTKPGDVDHYTRVRCYQRLMQHYPQNTAMLSLLPLAMRMGGPREAIWHAIIRKNHGCTHLVVGRDHAGPGKDNNGKPFYGPYDAQELLKSTKKSSA